MADRDLTGRMLGEFVLLEKIGQGGFGSVYRAEQPLLKRYVVVKVLRTDNDTAVQRFLQEAQLASRFDHPFAAHIYAFGVDEDEDLLWIAMELVQGITLGAWLEQHGPMALEQFVPFFEGVADAVHAAHESGIVHRDLKPSNVMVIERGGRLLPKLLDFGIAKLLDRSADGSPAERHRPAAAATTRIRPRAQAAERTVTSSNPEENPRLTRTGVAFGSRPYMSPEQWSDVHAVGPASDVYSLGIVAYETLTGRLPYIADNSYEYSRLHQRAEMPPLGDGFSSGVQRVIGCALSKLPEHRYRSALEMAAELREALQVQPREQLRSLAKVWNDRARTPALLLRGGDLLHTPSAAIGDLEQAFVAASHRRTARLLWLRRILVVSAAALALVSYQSVMNTRAARQVAEATATQSELEQGRSALLHNEPDAGRHLAEAYRRDHSPSTAFMLARALQPRLAERARLPSTFERVWSAMFSPDGKNVVTTDDRNAQIWDAQSYRLLFTLKHGDVVHHAVYSADGTRLVTGCGDGAVRIWDPTRGVLLRELRREGIGLRYHGVALSSDGKVVVGLASGVTHVWEVATGLPIAELRETAPSSYWVLAFSADNRWLATGTGNDVYLYDTQNWTLVHSIPGPSIHALSWDPTGSRLLTGSEDGDASIWALPGGDRVGHLRALGEPIDAVAFSPDGRLVAAGGRDGAEQVWDASSAKLRSQSNHLRNRVLSVEFDRSSSLIVAASSSGSAAVSEAASGMPVTVLDGPSAVVRDAHFDPSSQRVVGASWDGTARIWDATAPYRRWGSPPLSDDCDVVTGLEPDRRFLAIRCKDLPTRVWDTAHDELVAELPSVTPVEGDFESAFPAVSAAGDRAAIARGNSVEVYELPTARLLRTVVHGAPVSTVAFAATGRDVVSGAIDGSLIVMRDNGAMTALPTSAGAIDVAGFLLDGRVVAVDSRRHLRVYDLGGATLAALETRARAGTLRMSPDSRRLVTVPDFAATVAAPELWDVEHYRPIAGLTSTGQMQAYSARFLTNDDVITACADGVIRLWDAKTGQLRRTYRGGSRFLADATLSADGTMLIGGGGDGQLRFWDAASGRPLWTMLAHRSHLIGVHVESTGDIVTHGFFGDVARWSLPAPQQVIEACARDERCHRDTMKEPTDKLLTR